jgi:hypothetical protein
MVAPYFGGLLIGQSDFGHPAGAVSCRYNRLGLPRFGLPPKICLVAPIAASARRVFSAGVQGCNGVVADNWK